MKYSKVVSAAVLFLSVSFSTASYAGAEAPALDSNIGSTCAGYSTEMFRLYKTSRYDVMQDYFGQYFNRLQSQEYGTSKAELMQEYFNLGQSKVHKERSRADNMVFACEAIFDEYNKGYYK